MPTTKSNDYHKKNFNYQDSLIIGLESTKDPILNTTALPIIEEIVDKVKALEVTKSFDRKDSDLS